MENNEALYPIRKQINMDTQLRKFKISTNGLSEFGDKKKRSTF